MLTVDDQTLFKDRVVAGSLGPTNVSLDVDLIWRTDIKDEEFRGLVESVGWYPLGDLLAKVNLGKALAVAEEHAANELRQVFAQLADTDGHHNGSWDLALERLEQLGPGLTNYLRAADQLGFTQNDDYEDLPFQTIVMKLPPDGTEVTLTVARLWTIRLDGTEIELDDILDRASSADQRLAIGGQRSLIEVIVTNLGTISNKIRAGVEIPGHEAARLSGLATRARNLLEQLDAAVQT